MLSKASLTKMYLTASHFLLISKALRICFNKDLKWSTNKVYSRRFNQSNLRRNKRSREIGIRLYRGREGKQEGRRRRAQKGRQRAVEEANTENERCKPEKKGEPSKAGGPDARSEETKSVKRRQPRTDSNPRSGSEGP